MTCKELSLNFNLSEITFAKLLCLYNKHEMAAIDLKGQRRRKITHSK